MNPEVSVIIPTYNSEDYIAQALESLFNQSYRNFEIILVDDASKDSTVRIARSFDDRRLHIISNSQNRGVSYGRNCGIRQAKGNWIALLDSDDWYAPERLEKLLQVAEQENADLVADDLFLIRDYERYPWSTLLRENESGIRGVELIDAVKLVTSDRPAPLNAKRNWSLGYTKPIIRREFLLKNKIQYNERVHVGEDFSLYLECLRHQARFCLVPQAYYYYRTLTASLSTRKPTEYLAQSCQITQSFIVKEENYQGDSQLLEALNQNLAIFEKRLAYYRAVESIKQRKIIKTLKQFAVFPFILFFFSSKLINILSRKSLALLDTKNPEYTSFAVSLIENQK